MIIFGFLGQNVKVKAVAVVSSMPCASSGVEAGAAGRPAVHGAAFRLADPGTWPAPDQELSVRDPVYGQVRVRAWHRLHPRIGASRKQPGRRKQDPHHATASSEKPTYNANATRPRQPPNPPPPPRLKRKKDFLWETRDCPGSCGLAGCRAVGAEGAVDVPQVVVGVVGVVSGHVLGSLRASGLVL